jgi:hypothetical protein
MDLMEESSPPPVQETTSTTSTPRNEEDSTSNNPLDETKTKEPEFDPPSNPDPPSPKPSDETKQENNPEGIESIKVLEQRSKKKKERGASSLWFSNCCPRISPSNLCSHVYDAPIVEEICKGICAAVTTTWISFIFQELRNI